MTCQLFEMLAFRVIGRPGASAPFRLLVGPEGSCASADPAKLGMARPAHALGIARAVPGRSCGPDEVYILVASRVRLQRIRPDSHGVCMRAGALQKPLQPPDLRRRAGPRGGGGAHPREGRARGRDPGASRLRLPRCPSPQRPSARRAPPHVPDS